MKFSIKVLMAMLLFCLPFAITSCGSDDDDDDKGPKTYTYEWTLSNATVSNGSISEQQAALNAQIAVNAILVKTFQILGTVNSDKQTLTVTGGEEKANDNKVKSAYYGVASEISAAATGMPDNARITIKRDRTKVIDNEKLK